jgi:hypothetical protein
MVRTLKIDIWSGDWFVETGLEGKDNPYPECIFAHFDILNGKIVYLHDFMLPTRKIIKSKNIGKEFLEVCNFVYIPREKGELVESKKQEFTGDFIDAMIFIQKILEKEGYGEKTA